MTSRTLIYLLLTMALLVGCSPAPTPSATLLPSQSAPTIAVKGLTDVLDLKTSIVTQTVPAESTPAPTKAPISIPGNTIPDIETGQASPVGKGTDVERLDAEEVIKLLGRQFAGWTVITDDEGKVLSVISTDTSTQESGGIMASAPESWRWDSNSQTWQHSTKDGQTVVVSSWIAFPGGWNEEQGKAAPLTKSPKEVIPAIDPDGKLHVILVYSPEDAQNLDPNLLTPLENGDYAYVGVAKDIALQDGQQVTRDKGGNLTVTNPDGSYYKVLEAWSQVAISEEAQHMSEPIGPDLKTPNVPYPPKDLTPEKANILYTTLTDKKSENEEGEDTPVAYFIDKDGNKIIIASFTQDGWKKTVPLPLETGVIAPTIRDENPKLLDIRITDSPISQFTHAMHKAGIEVDNKELIEGLEYQVIHDKDGNPIVVATVNVNSFPEKYKDLNGDYPLFVAIQGKNGEWKWWRKEPPLRLFADIIGLKIGNIPQGGAYATNKEYNKLGEHFNLITNHYILWKWTQPTNKALDLEPAKHISERASSFYNQEQIGFHLIQAGGTPQWVKEGNYSDKELEQIIRKHIRDTMTPFKGKIKYWVVVNEFHPQSVQQGYEKDYLYSRLGFR